MDYLIEKQWKNWQCELKLNIKNPFSDLIFCDGTLIDIYDSDDSIDNVLKRYRKIRNHKIPVEYENCKQYHCYNATLQYHKYCQPISYHQTLQSFNNPASIKFLEHIWYNTINEFSFRITGDYIIEFVPSCKSNFLAGMEIESR